jgi:hypothetical protein
MVTEKEYLVITTINNVNVNEALQKFIDRTEISIIIVADKKTPDVSTTLINPNVTFYSTEQQEQNGFKLYQHIPWNHYCRKNLGYLVAIQKGARRIAETDDDNIPYPEWGDDISLGYVKGIKQISGTKVFNIYTLFTDEFIWPRGFPLDEIGKKNNASIEARDPIILIWQSLADQEPDVDAIFRLVFPNKVLNFNHSPGPFVLDEGTYCPFNSQNTFWSWEAFPYLYLPITVSSRFTDILRGYIAQRGIWSMGGRLAFGKATVYQERNIHNLMEDFRQEIDLYFQTKAILKALDSCSLSGKPTLDIRILYTSLKDIGVVKDQELEALDAWLGDLQVLGAIKSYKDSQLT